MNPDLIYEDMIEFPALKKFMEEMLVDYNATPGVVRMDLVLFKVRDCCSEITMMVNCNAPLHLALWFKSTWKWDIKSHTFL